MEAPTLPMTPYIDLVGLVLPEHVQTGHPFE